MDNKTDFLRSISVEEDPFPNEIPDEIRFFDLDGIEVTDDVTK